MRVHNHAGNLFAKTEICNLSPETRGYIEGLGLAKINDLADSYSSPWWHALAIGFSPSYLAEHSEGIAIGWPRIPMPAASADFGRSAALGKHLAVILSPDASVTGITSGTIAEHQRIFGVLSAADLGVRGWGHLDTKRRVNPGKGRVEKRHYTSTEKEAIRRGTEALGIEEARALELLGPPIDIYLNGTTCWRCVPTAVWEYFIREESILGRPLTKDEAREVTGMIRRLAAIVLLTDELDANYVIAKNAAVPWLVKTS
jgi:hypothetical protein